MSAGRARAGLPGRFFQECAKALIQRDGRASLPGAIEVRFRGNHGNWANHMADDKRHAQAAIIERIKRELKQRIDVGDLAEGAQVPSEYELARQFGVSRNQTRLALRDLSNEGYILRSQGRRSIVAPETQRLRILPFHGARAVAIALPEYQSDLSRFLLDGFMTQAAESNCQAIAYNLRFDVRSEVSFLRHVRDTGIHGLAIWLQHNIAETRAMFEQFQATGFPFVLVDHAIQELPTDAVTTDNEALGHGLTRELIRQGHTNIGFIAEATPLLSGLQRHEGYRRALREAGLPVRDTSHGVFGRGRDNAVVQEIMAWREPPTAFLCTHDCIAQDLASELRDLGYSTPGDITLAAPDDHVLTRPHGLEMVTAIQPSSEMGRQAAELLVARIQDPFRPVETRSLPPRFPFAEEASAASAPALSASSAHAK